MAQCCYLLAIGLLGLDDLGSFWKLAWLPEHGDLSGQNLLHHMVFICHGPFQLGGQCTDGLMFSLTGKAIGQLAISCQRIWQVECPVPLSNHANRWKCFVESGQRLFYGVEKRSSGCCALANPCQKLDYGLTGPCHIAATQGLSGLMEESSQVQNWVMALSQVEQKLEPSLGVFCDLQKIYFAQALHGGTPPYM